MHRLKPISNRIWIWSLLTNHVYKQDLIKLVPLTYLVIIIHYHSQREYLGRCFLQLTQKTTNHQGSFLLSNPSLPTYYKYITHFKGSPHKAQQHTQTKKTYEEMRTSTLISASLLLLSFLLIHHSNSYPFPAISKDIINKTCETCATNSKTFFSYGFCFTSLQAIPISHFTNLQGLALITMELAIQNATNTISSIEVLLNSETFNQNSTMRLKDCLGLYSHAIMSVANSLGAFLMEDFDNANECIIDVKEAVSVCEDGFEKEGEVSPLIKEGKNLSQLCDITLCIIYLLVLAFPSSL